MNRTTCYRWLPATLSVVTLLLPLWAFAEAGDALEEVVVTARQREEKLVDVPISIQAFTAADIEAAGITRPVDFIALTSGVSSVQTAEAGDLQVNIRGINTGRDAEPNFAMVVDGVLVTNPFALNQELANVKQIEVLKGPQGAVYGRNAVAGAFIITTKKPGTTAEAEVGASVANRSTYRANTWLAMPLSDTVSVGVEVFYTKTDGLFDNSFLNCSDCVDYHKEYGAAPRVIFKLGDNGELDLKVESGAINFNAVFALPAFTGLNAKFQEDVNDHQFNYINNIRPQNEQENKQISLKGEWKFAVGTLTSWIAYNNQTNFFLTDGTSAAFGLYAATPWCQADINAQVGGPLPAPTFYAGANSILPAYSPSRCDGYQYQQRDQKDTSAEIRLASPGNQRLRWLGGVYYADIKRRQVVSQGSDQGLGLLTQPLVRSGGPNPTDLLYDDDFTSKVSAVFGQVAYDVLPNLEAALALRYDNERRHVDNNVPKIGPQTTGFGPFGGVICPTGQASCTAFINPFYNVAANAGASSIPSRSKSFSQLQPKLSLNWKFIDNWSAFASWGVGFRSGGFNSTGSAATVAQYFGAFKYVNPAGVVTTTPALGDVNDEYRKEVSRAAEIGVKAELLDNSLSLSAGYYYTKVKDAQYFNFFAGPFGLLRVVTNIDRATLQGFEADVRWKPSRIVTLFAGFGSNDSKIDRYTGRPYTAGNKMPYAPEYTGNAGVQLNLPVSKALSLVARLDSTFLGKTWFSPVQNNAVQTVFFTLPGDYARTERDAVSILNARLGVAGDRWSVIAWSRNLTDKNYLAEVIPAPEFGGSFVHEAPTRTVGVDLSYRFAGN
jgi:iron complex outermembrane recepter protein